MPQAVRFKNPYQGYDPATIFSVDEASRNLRPISSAEAYTGAGYQFGQESIGDPNAYSGYSIGPAITRADQLAQIRDQLNSFQQETFNDQQSANKRASSSLTESITSQQGNLDKYLTEYTDLRKRLEGLAAPNYQAEFNTLREKQGIPGFEQEYLGLSKQRRELPYVERANTGNAGVTIESQLQAQTAQKDIPLYIQQSNVLDRLKLAQDFVNNSLSLKELDYNASRNSLSDALKILGDTATFTQNNLSQLVQRQQEEQRLALAAQEFAIQNGIDAPLYQVGNVIYDTATRTPKYVNNGGTISTADGKTAFSKPEQFFKDSGVNSFDQIYQINSTTLADKNAVLDLRQRYPDAGISSTDSFATASSKLQNSRIYREQVRGPVGSGGGGGSGGVLGLSNQQIDNISPLVSQFQSSPIVQNYNTIGEGYNFAKGISSTTKNPSDHQALIYAFAKAMDPGSVVREGEYATVQKYAQSWVKAYGKSVDQAINGTGFLSQDAINGIKKTIETRFKASETSYKNLYGETERRINLIGNTDKGSQLLNNYGGAFAQPSAGSISTEQVVEQAPTQSFWKKATNWLFGK